MSQTGGEGVVRGAWSKGRGPDTPFVFPTYPRLVPPLNGLDS